MGAGHTVTALYELVPSGIELPDAASAARSERFPNGRPVVDALRYQAPVLQPTAAARTSELLTVKVRYKSATASTSQLIEQPLRPGSRASHLPFAAAVAEFGLLLREPAPLAPRWQALTERLRKVGGGGSAADREAFADLVEAAAGIKRQVR